MLIRTLAMASTLAISALAAGPAQAQNSVGDLLGTIGRSLGGDRDYDRSCPPRRSDETERERQIREDCYRQVERRDTRSSRYDPCPQARADETAREKQAREDCARAESNRSGGYAYDNRRYDDRRVDRYGCPVAVAGETEREKQIREDCARRSSR
jgi:hypothetical protein